MSAKTAAAQRAVVSGSSRRDQRLLAGVGGRRRRGVMAVVVEVVVVAGLVVAGCSSETQSMEPEDRLAGMDLSAASPEQAAEIADRVATEAEYHAAFARYEECMAAGGYPLGDVRMEGPLYEFAVPAAAVESSDVDARCYATEFDLTDFLWQTSVEGADSSTTEALQECLRERGVEPAESDEAISEQLADEGISVGECFA